MNKTHNELLTAQQLTELFQFAMTLCKNRADALDLIQESVEKYLQESHKNAACIDKPVAFVRTIIRNRFIDKHRHKQRFEHRPYEEEAIYDISPASLEDIAIARDSLEKIWQELEPIDREILYHWAVLGHSTDETCNLMDMARGTLLSRIHRLRKRLTNEHSTQPRKQEGV